MKISLSDYACAPDKSITIPTKSRLVKRWWMQASSHHSTLLKEIKQELINTGWKIEESETPAHGETTYYITSEEAPAPFFWEGGIIGLFHSGYAIIKVRNTSNGHLIFQSDGKYNDERQQAVWIVDALNDKIGVKHH